MENAEMAGARGESYGVCVAPRGELRLGSLHRRHQDLDCRRCLGPLPARSASTRRGFGLGPAGLRWTHFDLRIDSVEQTTKIHPPVLVVSFVAGGDSRVFMRNGGGL